MRTPSERGVFFLSLFLLWIRKVQSTAVSWWPIKMENLSRQRETRNYTGADSGDTTL